MATNLAQIAAFVGFLLPLLVAVIQRQHWSAPVRTVVGLACIVVAATVVAWAQGSLNFHDWTTSLIAVFTIAQVSYQTVWKKTNIAPVIEAKTSPNGGAPPTTFQRR